MGLTHVNVTLKNSGEVEMYRRRLIGEDEVRSLDIHCLVNQP